MKEKFNALLERFDRSGRILLIVLGVVILLTILLMILPRRQPELPPQKEKAVPVEVIDVQVQNLPNILMLPGLVLADVDARLSAETQGRVVELLVDRGQAVTNGQVLLRLDDRAARIAFEDAARTLKRFDTLSGTGAVSQKQLDDIRRAYDLAKTTLSYYTVKSPVDGIVNERYVEEGEYVLPATALFDVLSIDPVRVTTDVPERNIGSLHLGDRIPFDVLSLGNRSFTGRVSYISAKAETGNNAFRIELTVPNKQGLLRPGMIASLRHRRGTRENAVALPLDAIIPQKGDNVVYIVRDGRAVRQLVRIDDILEQQAVILSGVKAGDRVVTRGNRMLNDGTAVEIREHGARE